MCLVDLLGCSRLRSGFAAEARSRCSHRAIALRFTSSNSNITGASSFAGPTTVHFAATFVPAATRPRALSSVKDIRGKRPSQRSAKRAEPFRSC